MRIQMLFAVVLYICFSIPATAVPIPPSYYQCSYLSPQIVEADWLQCSLTDINLTEEESIFTSSMSTILESQDRKLVDSVIEQVLLDVLDSAQLLTTYKYRY